jgi:hypothetical protein
MKNDILTILRAKSTVLSFKEICIAVGEKNPNLLKRRLNYYVQKGVLLVIRRGLYVKDTNYDRFEAATKIFTPSYISFETVLLQAGVIFQYYAAITVATYQTKEIECDRQSYSFRKIKDTILTNHEGLENKGTYFVATKERAFLDLLYLHREYHFDNLAPLDIQQIHSLLPIYNNKRMEKCVQNYFQRIKSREKS